MRLTISLLAATVISLAGYTGLANANVTIPAFHDGQAVPKTIAVVVAHSHPVAPNLVGRL
jgi:hypothetical protein